MSHGTEISAMRAIARSFEPGQRKGLVTVEYAVVLSLVFVVLWGIIEMGRMVLVADCLIQAAQEGARVGIVPGSTSAQVTAEVNTILSGSFVSGATVTTTPSDITTLKTAQPLTVSVSVPFSSVSWLPTPQFLKNKVLKTSCVMLKEGK
jgi:Flp pilus assembly protein TadG